MNGEPLRPRASSAKLPLAERARSKAAKAGDGFEDAEKTLSNYYIRTKARYIAKHAVSYQPFKKTFVRDASLFLVEQWMHHLKREGVRPNVIVDALAAIRTPLSRVAKRNILDEPFSMSAIVRPKEHHEKRGILSRTEAARIAALPTVDEIVPSPRLKVKKKNESPSTFG